MTPEDHRHAARNADAQALRARTKAETRSYRRQATEHRIAAHIAAHRLETR